MKTPFFFKVLLNFSLLVAMVFPYQVFSSPKKSAEILPFLKTPALQRVAKHFGPKAFRTENILSMLQTRFSADEDTKYFWENRHKFKQEIVPAVRAENDKLIVQAGEAPAVIFSRINPLSETMLINGQLFDLIKYKSLKGTTETLVNILDKTQPKQGKVYNLLIPEAQAAAIAPTILGLVMLAVAVKIFEVPTLGGLLESGRKMDEALAACENRGVDGAPYEDSQAFKLLQIIDSNHHFLDRQREIHDCEAWAKANGKKIIEGHYVTHCRKGEALLRCMDRYKAGQAEPASGAAFAPTTPSGHEGEPK
jgi:hypothetical protein